MTRLIDKDLLIEILGEMQGLCDTKAALIQNSKIWQQVKDLPTVDAVPVIRCKDCKHYDGYYCHNKWWGNGYGNYTPPIKDEDGFCDWAERRDNDR